MPTLASGRSLAQDTIKAGREAFAEALAKLGGQKPVAGFVFAGPNHELNTLLKTGRELVPGAELMGATTAGEFTEKGLSHRGVALMLIAGNDLVAKGALVRSIAENAVSAGDSLAKGFKEARASNEAKGRAFSLTVAVVEGTSGVGGAVMQELAKQIGPLHRIAGGAAGDEKAFTRTQVAYNANSSTDGAALLHLFGAKPSGIGVRHGFQPATKPMKITKINGSTVEEIDGAPAFQAYQTYARQAGVDLPPDKIMDFMTSHPLGLMQFGEVYVVRAPLVVNAGGGVVCTGDIPEGATISIMRTDPDALIDAARTSAKEAVGNLRGQPVAGMLVFDCAGRNWRMGDDAFARAITAIQEAAPKAPLAGFCTYGEAAQYGGSLFGWHNSTCVVCAVAA